MRLIVITLTVCFSLASNATGDTGPAWWDAPTGMEIIRTPTKVYVRAGSPYRVKAWGTSKYRTVYAIPSDQNAAWRAIGRVAVGDRCGMSQPLASRPDFHTAVTETGLLGMAPCAGDLHCVWAYVDRVPDIMAILPQSWQSVAQWAALVPHVPLDAADESICNG